MLAWFAVSAGLGLAQTPPQPDPAAALLLAQPQIDTTAPVTATASFDPPVVRPGGTSTYRVTFNAMMDSIQWPEDVIAPKQLELQPGGRGQIFLPSGTSLQPRTTINTRALATTAGVFTVPRYLVYVYGKPVTVPEAQLQVATDPTVPLASGPKVQLEFSNTNVFLGQSVTARVVMQGDSNGLVQALTMVKLLGEGFLADQTSARQRVESIRTETNQLPTFIYEIDVTPIVPGQLQVSAQGFTAGNQFAGPITISGRVTIPGGPPQYLLLDTPPVTLNVRPLPPEGRLPGYSGAIGQFKLDSPTLATNVLQVGDPVTFSVRVLGTGNLARLVPPAPPQVSGWKVFAGTPDPGPPQLINARGFIGFNYTLVPTTEKARNTPPIPFSYFDPEKMAYVDLSLPALPVTVKPSAVPVNVAALAEAEAAGPEREPEPKLSNPATTPGRTMSSLTPWQQHRWFPAVQLAPALLFAGLWWWDRRRRHLAAHPEILLRRRARRALQREWAALRQAARLGDTSRYAACAVNAMRVACAPHFPAEPRALVSSDVLPLLPEADAAIQSAVRQVFATVNAERFATAPENTSSLLSLRADVDRVLAQLEGKLR